MAYRSKRFDPGEMKGLKQVWRQVDSLDALGLPIRTEVMAGSSYRRPLHPSTIAEIGDHNYIIQAVFKSPEAAEKGRTISARRFVDGANEILERLRLPGDAELDAGGLNGLDPTTTSLAFGSTGSTEKDILQIYPPWVSTEWVEANRRCMFFCGIEPPQPKALLEDHMFDWGEDRMRKGMVVFEQTPDSLETY